MMTVPEVHFGFPVTVKWTYAGPRMAPTCTVTCGLASRTWEHPTAELFITERERYEVPRRLRRELLAPLPPPQLGDDYFRSAA